MKGDTRLNNYLYMNDKEVIRATDGWLRINQSKAFTSGVHTPTYFYASGGLRVDNGATINGNLVANSWFRCGPTKIRFWAGSTVFTANGYLGIVGWPMNNASINSALGVTGSHGGNTAVFVCNGDHAANGALPYGAAYQNDGGKWMIVGVNTVGNAAVRINFLVIRW